MAPTSAPCRPSGAQLTLLIGPLPRGWHPWLYHAAPHGAQNPPALESGTLVPPARPFSYLVLRSSDSLGAVMAEPTYYLRLRGRVSGPFTVAQLQAMHQRGQ